MVLGKLPAIFVGAGFTKNLSFTSTIFINPPSSYVIFICKNSHLAPFSRTGKMPVPKENSLFVEQASCLLIKSLLRMVQHLSYYSHFAPFSIILLGRALLPNPYSPQENLIFVKPESLFLSMVQNVSFYK